MLLHTVACILANHSVQSNYHARSVILFPKPAALVVLVADVTGTACIDGGGRM